jgi:branched-chain amino acid transport system ATP-binding protein
MSSAMNTAVSAPILRLSGVHTHIGAYHILHGVDLDIPAGQLTMLLGRNGAGKTTTLRTIMGLWRASAGRITLGPVDIGALATPDIARQGIAYVPENMGIFSDLTVAENLTLAARAARHAGAIDAARLEWIFELFPALRKFWLHRAGLLSGGQKQMLAVARAIIEPRRLLLIDEPSKGLAPAIIQNMISALRELKGTDTTILLVEQNFSFARQLGDQVAVMDDGVIVHRGAMQELAEDDALQRRLLGLSLAAHQ